MIRSRQRPLENAVILSPWDHTDAVRPPGFKLPSFSDVPRKKCPYCKVKAWRRISKGHSACSACKSSNISGRFSRGDINRPKMTVTGASLSKAGAVVRRPAEGDVKEHYDEAVAEIFTPADRSRPSTGWVDSNQAVALVGTSVPEPTSRTR